MNVIADSRALHRQTPMALQIDPATRRFDAVVDLPGSKSYTNRALLIAALARGHSRITDALSSDDTRSMRRALAALGVRLEEPDEHTFIVGGVDGRFPVSSDILDVGGARTAARCV